MNDYYKYFVIGAFSMDDRNANLHWVQGKIGLRSGALNNFYLRRNGPGFTKTPQKLSFT